MSKRTLQDLLYNEMQQNKGLPKKTKLCCQEQECFKPPTHGFLEKCPTHCFGHRLSGMYNVVGRHCQNEDEVCFTAASFGYPGHKPLFCRSHKQDGMVNLVSRRCVACPKIACYGDLRIHPTHCAEHREEHMVSKWSPDRELYKAEVITITSNSCALCSVKAYFGNCMTGRKFCKTHMNPATDWRISHCKHDKCKEVATYMAQDTLEVFCGKHAEDNPHTIQFAPPLAHSIAPNLIVADESLPSLFPEIDF
jgi:hypothetical protein